LLSMAAHIRSILFFVLRYTHLNNRIKHDVKVEHENTIFEDFSGFFFCENDAKFMVIL